MEKQQLKTAAASDTMQKHKNYHWKAEFTKRGNLSNQVVRI